MKIAPFCEIKKLSECEGGELLRLMDHGEKGDFAFAAELIPPADKENTRKALIVLTSDRVKFEVRQNLELHQVLSYGNEYELRIDQGPSFEGFAQEMYSVSGCIVRNSKNWLLNVQPINPRYSRATMQYDIQEGKLRDTDRDINGIAVFGKWELLLRVPEDEPGEKLRVAKFDWKERSDGQRA